MRLWPATRFGIPGLRRGLHLGLYRRGQGAIDPQPYVAYQPQNLSSVYSDTSSLGEMNLERYPNTVLRTAPHPQAASRAQLDRHLPVELIAASKYWCRVRLADGYSGYLPAEQLETTDVRWRKLQNCSGCQGSSPVRWPAWRRKPPSMYWPRPAIINWYETKGLLVG